MNAEARGWLELSVKIALHGPSGPFRLDLDLSVAEGAFIALVGPSGAGKTTLLRLLAGLSQPDSGRVSVGGVLWCDTSARIHVPTRHRSIGFVFQDYALFPNMTVRDNVEYAMGRSAQADDVQKLLELVELAGLAGAYPARLSGGQKQRLALIRALARRPSILILDEPLSALDPVMRRQLQDELKSLHRQFGTTTVLVSHDISEILRLADRVVRLQQGQVVFDGSPAQAFGMTEKNASFCLIGEHISGPDSDGYATVRLDGRLCRMRYGEHPDTLSIGDTVMLQVDEVTTQRPA